MRCRMLAEVGRRQFLRGGTTGAAGAAAAVLAGGVPAKAAPAAARVTYPSSRLANLAELKVDEPVDVALVGHVRLPHPSTLLRRP